MTTTAVRTSTEGSVLVITLDRPEVRNAIDSHLSLGVLEALGRLDDDADLRVGVLTGAGDDFCAGLDLRAFARAGLPEGIGKVFKHGARKPVVAAVEGVALGGGLEMALVADLVVAADDARLGASEVRWGLFPAGGTLFKLPRTMPRSVVNAMVLTGEPLDAAAALEHGLVVEVTPPGGALEAALRLARTIAANAPLGVQACKELLTMAPGMTDHELWRAQAGLVAKVYGSDDAREGAAAFAERRPPEWTGR